MKCFRLHDTRSRIYELLTHCIPADLILRVCSLCVHGRCLVTLWQSIAVELVRNIDGQLKGEIIQLAAQYEHRLQVCAIRMHKVFPTHAVCAVRQQGHLPH